MNRLFLAVAVSALVALPAFAQTPGPGQDRAETSNPATAAEKAKAKAARKAEGRDASRTAVLADDEPGNTATGERTTKAERKEAAAKRKAEGAKAVKSPKDTSGPS